MLPESNRGKLCSFKMFDALKRTMAVEAFNIMISNHTASVAKIEVMFVMLSITKLFYDNALILIKNDNYLAKSQFLVVQPVQKSADWLKTGQHGSCNDPTPDWT